MPRLIMKQGILSPPPAGLLTRSINIGPDTAFPLAEETREKPDDLACSLPSTGGARARDENAGLGHYFCHRQGG